MHCVVSRGALESALCSRSAPDRTPLPLPPARPSSMLQVETIGGEWQAVLTSSAVWRVCLRIWGAANVRLCCGSRFTCLGGCACSRA